MNNIVQWLDENSAFKNECWQFPTEHGEVPARRLQAQSVAVASELYRLGVKKGDKVGLFFDNTSYYLAMLLAIWRLNAVVVPLAPKSLQQSRFARQTALIESDFRIKWLVYSSSTHEDVLLEWMRLCDALAFHLDHFKNMAGAAATRLTMDAAKCINDDDIAVVKIPNNAYTQANDTVLTHGMLVQQLNETRVDSHLPLSMVTSMFASKLLSLVTLPLAS
jgi:acyl-CoA synthetase (AMP-forming)/AMP-acid ligase II